MTTIDEVAADLEAVKGATPTAEELLFSTLVPCWNGPLDKLTGANAMTFLVAPIQLRVLSIAFSFEYWSLPPSDTNFWTMTAKKGSNTTTWDVVATRSTQNTGANANGGVTARKAWTFDAAAWGDADLAAGDLLRVDFAPTGSPAALDMPFTCTIRYRPL
jgi:hypothetical protein